MSEAERDSFDKSAEKALTQFHTLVKALRTRIHAANSLRIMDETPHLEAVAKILERRLKSVADTVTELRYVIRSPMMYICRKLRLENARQRKRYSRLSSLVEQYMVSLVCFLSHLDYRIASL